MVQPVDPGDEEALYDSAVMRQFVGIDLGCEPAPNQPTVCKFRHLFEEHQLGERILGQVNLHLQAQGVRITTGNHRGRDHPARADFDQEARATSAIRRCTRRRRAKNGTSG